MYTSLKHSCKLQVSWYCNFNSIATIFRGIQRAAPQENVSRLWIPLSRRAVQMSDKAWLIGRRLDASQKIFVATRILVFDFELV